MWACPARMVDRECHGDQCMDPMRSLPFCSSKVMSVQTAGYSKYEAGNSARLISTAWGVWSPMQGSMGLITEPCIWPEWVQFVEAVQPRGLLG